MRTLKLLCCTAAIASATADDTVFFKQGSPCHYWVPADDSIGQSWVGVDPPPNFDLWTAASLGLGFDSSNYVPYFDTDLSAEMRTINATVYVRAPFQVDAATLAELTELRLDVRGEDGYVIYLNGTEVHRLQAPDVLTWNSNATGNLRETIAEAFTAIDLSPHIHLLEEGANLIAFHAMNSNKSSSDFLLSPRLVGVDPIVELMRDDQYLQITDIEIFEPGESPGGVVEDDLLLTPPWPPVIKSVTVGVETGKSYDLQVSSNLTDWNSFGIPQTAREVDGMRLTFSPSYDFALPSGSFHFRVTELD